MNRIASVISLLTRDKAPWFILPWSILAASFSINVLISLLLRGSVAIYTGGIASIYVYMLILGSMVVRDTFPFALGFSLRRTDYYLGSMAVIVGTSAAFALGLLLMGGLESLTGGWGLNLHFFHLPYLGDGSIVAQFWILFATMMLSVLLGFVCASIFARFGRTGLLTLFGMLGVFATFGSFFATYNNWWPSIFEWITQWSAAQLGLWMLPIIALCALGSYLSLRKATL